MKHFRGSHDVAVTDNVKNHVATVPHHVLEAQVGFNFAVEFLFGQELVVVTLAEGFVLFIEGKPLAFNTSSLAQVPPLDKLLQRGQAQNLASLLALSLRKAGDVLAQGALLKQVVQVAHHTVVPDGAVHLVPVLLLTPILGGQI